MTSGNAPHVTVIVPVYNGERFLAESLDSILAQTYSRMDVLVMDDASTDGTAAILSSYGARIRVVTQAANRGIYGNMNDGIAQAAGDIIAIYHADDVYDPRIVETEVDFLLRHPEAGAVFCSDIFIDPDGAERGRLSLPAEVGGSRPLDYRTVFNALLRYRNVFLRCPSCMVRAEVYESIGPYRDALFRNTADLDMYLRIARDYRIGVLEDHLYKYRWGHGNSGQRYRHLRTDEERYFSIMDLFLERDRPIAADDALAAFAAHRNQDRLMRIVNLYIAGRIGEARALLGQVHAGTILASGRVQRGRLLLLQAILTVLVRLPHLPVVARAFYRRWHGTGGWRGTQPARASVRPNIDARA